MAYVLVVESGASVVLDTPNIRFWLIGIPMVVGLLTLARSYVPSIIWAVVITITSTFLYLFYDNVPASQWEKQKRDYAVFLMFLYGINLLSFLYHKKSMSYKAQVETVLVELIASKDAAEAGVRAKQDFLATMSHEIRTPLHGIIGMTQVLANTSMSSAQRESMVVIQHCGDVLMNLINNVLDLSSLEAGLMRLHSNPISVHTILQQVIDVVNIKAAQKGVKLLTHVEDAVPKVVMADAGGLLQIVMNITANAVKFTEVGSVSVHVSLTSSIDGYRPTTPPDVKKGGEENEQYLLFSIEDTGAGISEDVQCQLFQKFMQGSSFSTRKHGGSGLGLAICKRLVKLMNGDIGMRSTVGKGTVLWFTIPLVRAHGDAVPINSIADRLTLEMDISDPDTSDAQSTLVRRKPHEHADSIECRSPVLRATILPPLSSSLPAFSITTSPSASSSPSAFSCSASASSLSSSTILSTLHASTSCPSFSSSAPTVSKPFQQLKILVVDDNDVNLRVAVKALEKIGFVGIEVAVNGEIALEKVTCGTGTLTCACKYDMIFMDIQMPGIDGWECTKRIRLLESGFEPSVIVGLSAHAYAADQVQHLCEGKMDFFLTKPFKIAEMRSITEVVQNKKKRLKSA